VREYETNDLASDSEDEKKIRQAEGCAMRNMKSKSRSAPYKVSVLAVYTGNRYPTCTADAVRRLHKRADVGIDYGMLVFDSELYTEHSWI
jgi:hypothetical protein